jgi:hypothetical protein
MTWSIYLNVKRRTPQNKQRPKNRQDRSHQNRANSLRSRGLARPIASRDQGDDQDEGEHRDQGWQPIEIKAIIGIKAPARPIRSFRL